MTTPPPTHSLAKPTCRLSDPAQPHKLRRRRFSRTPFVCFACKGEQLRGSRYYYYCDTCNLGFHRGCHLYPPKIRHPYHPSHPLTLINLDPAFDVSKIPNSWNSDSSFESIEFVDGGYGNDDDSASSDERHEKCKCCRKRLDNLYYHCSLCNFSLSISCTEFPPLLTIEHLKSHEHTLTLFPKLLPLPCDACGFSLDSHGEFVYSCFPCNYMVHRKCIYLPRVIKITRHPHRLSFTSFLQPNDFSCGVCRKAVDINYGQYSCVKGCRYAVHSKCATSQLVWDEKDLEGVPEEPEEDINPFVQIDEETIQHFSHQHYLTLHKNNSLGDEMMFCEACCLPVTISESFYRCMQCKFVLHEACACLPRIKHHPLHKHALILQISTQGYEIDHYQEAPSRIEFFFRCHGCDRLNCGFIYQCGEGDCRFKLDVRCASLPDPLIHASHALHDHPLFINLTKGKCLGCKSISCSPFFLECMKCNSMLGVRCATVPTVAHYKHDRHPLTLSYGEEDTLNRPYWCEICESNLNAKTWFYKCDYCRVTLHLTCLLGETNYMKPNHIIKIDCSEIGTALNDGNSRPFCYHCGIRCLHIVVFKCRGGGGVVYKWRDGVFCTLYCLKLLIDSE